MTTRWITWMGECFMLGFVCWLWASFPTVKILCRLYNTQTSFGWYCKTVACVYMHAKRSYAHVKDPLVHVRVKWITETQKHPAYIVHWASELVAACFAWGKQPKFLVGEIPEGQYSCKKVQIARWMARRHILSRMVTGEDEQSLTTDLSKEIVMCQSTILRFTRKFICVHMYPSCTFSCWIMWKTTFIWR